jgi:hypothetical protein
LDDNKSSASQQSVSDAWTVILGTQGEAGATLTKITQILYLDKIGDCCEHEELAAIASFYTEDKTSI